MRLLEKLGEFVRYEYYVTGVVGVDKIPRMTQKNVDVRYGIVKKYQDQFEALLDCWRRVNREKQTTKFGESSVSRVLTLIERWVAKLVKMRR